MDAAQRWIGPICLDRTSVAIAVGGLALAIFTVPAPIGLTLVTEANNRLIQRPT